MGPRRTCLARSTGRRHGLAGCSRSIHTTESEFDPEFYVCNVAVQYFRRLWRTSAAALQDAAFRSGGRMNFASDNTAGIAPEILDAIIETNAGFALGYGNDDVTKRVERRLCDIFEREVAAFIVPTGTAANALALAHVTAPWGGVL